MTSLKIEISNNELFEGKISKKISSEVSWENDPSWTVIVEQLLKSLNNYGYFISNKVIETMISINSNNVEKVSKLLEEDE